MCQSSIISQILELIYWTVMIFIFDCVTVQTENCFTAAMLVPLGRAPTWRFHTKLYKFGWNTFPNNARMKNCTELNLGKLFYVWLIYHIQDSWLNSLNGYDIYFWLRGTANQPFHATNGTVIFRFVRLTNPRPLLQVSRENTRSNGGLFYLCLLALGLLNDSEVKINDVFGEGDNIPFIVRI